MHNYFIVVSCGEEGTPRLPQRAQGKNYFLHKTIDSAYAEAVRLAKQHQGIKFGVFEWHTMVSFEKQKPVDIEIEIKVP